MKTALKVIPAIAIAGAVAAIATLDASPVLADAAGDKQLAAIDEALSRAKTHHFTYEVTIKSPDKGDRTAKLDVKMKGEKRLTEFLAPADVKGTKVLILSPTQMYIYLPAFGKVRRIASHTTEQGFMGMTFSQDDMLLTTYSGFYNATGSDKLSLTEKKDSGAPYPKLELTVDKSLMPTKIEYFSDTGTNVKSETRSGYTCEGNICTAGEQTMVDHTKGDASTTLKRTSWKVNESMSDDIFSKRALEQGS